MDSHSWSSLQSSGWFSGKDLPLCGRKVVWQCILGVRQNLCVLLQNRRDYRDGWWAHRPPAGGTNTVPHCSLQWCCTAAQVSSSWMGWGESCNLRSTERLVIFSTDVWCHLLSSCFTWRNQIVVGVAVGTEDLNPSQGQLGARQNHQLDFHQLTCMTEPQPREQLHLWKK